MNNQIDNMQQLNIKLVENVVENMMNISSNVVTANAFQSTDFSKLVLNHGIIDNMDHIFSHQIADGIEVMNQESAGLCWMCAGITMCRRAIIKKFNLTKKFHISLNYLLFWDKLERCNYFINFIINNKQYKFNSKKINAYTKHPISDGGHWHTFVDLINKYGIVPDSICRRRVSSKNTASMNKLINYKLREFAAKILSPNLTDDEMYKSEERINLIRNDILSTIIKILVYVLGSPIYPDSKFDWIYVTKEDNKKIINDLTPIDFYRNYCINFNDYVLVANDPRPRHSYNKLYEMTSVDQMVTNRSDTKSHIFLNLETNELIDLITKQINAGIPVWFSCDVIKYSNHKYNIFDIDLYNYDLPFNTSFNAMSKADRLDFHDSYANHAMCIVGYDIGDVEGINKIDVKIDNMSDTSDTSDTSDETDMSNISDIDNTNNIDIPDNLKEEFSNKYNKRKRLDSFKHPKKMNIKKRKITETKKISITSNKVSKFKVENSWGNIGDKDGFYLMTSDWFKQFAYEIVINKEYLTETQKLILDTNPTKLNRADPLSKIIHFNNY